MRFLRVPLQHVPIKFETNGVTILPQDSLGVIEHIIGINDANLNLTRLQFAISRGDLGSDETLILEIVE